MIDGRRWTLAELRDRLARHPLAGPLVRGLVFRSGPVLFVLDDDDRPRIDGDAATLDPSAVVSIAHPADGLDGWPTRAREPFVQRERRVFGSADLPDAVERVPHARWQSARKSLRWSSYPESTGGTSKATKRRLHHEIELRHTGFGAGYGGRGPIGVRSATVTWKPGPQRATWYVESEDDTKGWERLPPAVASEAIYELLALYGLADGFHSAPRPEVERVPPKKKSSKKEKKGASGAPSKGDRVRTADGAEGVVFWVGNSKYGKGMRVGLKDDASKTHWAAASDVEVLD